MNLNISVTLEGKCLSINMICWTMTLEDMTNIKQTDTPCCPSFRQLYNDYFATPPHTENKTFAVQINKKKHMPSISDMYRCEMMQYLEKQTKPSTIYDNYI